MITHKLYVVLEMIKFDSQNCFNVGLFELVSARVGVAGQIRPVGDAATSTQTRPVLLHATTTHKQVTLTQQTQVQVTVIVLQS